MKKALIIILILSFCITDLCWANDKDYSILKNSIDSIADKYKLPGLSISIVSIDSVLFIHNYGYSNLKAKHKVDLNTQFKVGSITKTFISLAFFKLSNEAKIDLNSNIKDLVPEINFKNPWNETKPIKIIHLLEHTSGFDDIHLNDLSLDNISNIPLYKVLEHQQKSLISRWEPGMYYSYSSVGYTLLGYILEKITGVSYEDYVKNEILIPFGMVNSDLKLENFPDEQTLGYDNKFNQLPIFYMYARPAGSMFSTLNDMSTFVQIMLHNASCNREHFLDSSLIAQIEKPQTGIIAEYGIKVGYGSGIFSTQKNGYKWYYHNGGGPGCLASYFYSHESGKGFCIMTNSFNIEAINKLKNLLFENLCPKKTDNNAEQRNLRFDTYEYLGYYELKNHRNELFSFLEDIFSGIRVYSNKDTVIVKELFSEDKLFIKNNEGLYRKQGEQFASFCYVNEGSKDKGILIGNNYYEKKSLIKPILIWIYIVLLFVLIVFVLFDFTISLISVLYKKLNKKKELSKVFILKISQMITFFFLFVPIIIVSNQSVIEFSQATSKNRFLCMGSWIYFTFSILTFALSIKIKTKYPKLKWINVYILISFLIFSLAMIFLNLNLIGLKLWDY